MIILTDDSKKLLDVVSIYVREKKDKEDLNKIFAYKVYGMLSTGLNIPIKSFDTEAEAIAFVENIARDFSACHRAKE